MDNEVTALRATLQTVKGQWTAIAAEGGLNYSTLVRFANGDLDSRASTVASIRKAVDDFIAQAARDRIAREARVQAARARRAASR